MTTSVTLNPQSPAVNFSQQAQNSSNSSDWGPTLFKVIAVVAIILFTIALIASAPKAALLILLGAAGTGTSVIIWGDPLYYHMVIPVIRVWATSVPGNRTVFVQTPATTTFVATPVYAQTSPVIPVQMVPPGGNLMMGGGFHFPQPQVPQSPTFVPGPPPSGPNVGLGGAGATAHPPQHSPPPQQPLFPHLTMGGAGRGTWAGF